MIDTSWTSMMIIVVFLTLVPLNTLGCPPPPWDKNFWCRPHCDSLPDTIVNDTNFWCRPHCAEIGHLQISPEVLSKILPILNWKSRLLNRQCAKICQKCSDVKQSRPICGSDQKTYSSLCSLRCQACKFNRSLKQAYPSRCQQNSSENFLENIFKFVQDMYFE